MNFALPHLSLQFLLLNIDFVRLHMMAFSWLHMTVWSKFIWRDETNQVTDPSLSSWPYQHTKGACVPAYSLKLGCIVCLLYTNQTDKYFNTGSNKPVTSYHFTNTVAFAHVVHQAQRKADTLNQALTALADKVKQQTVPNKDVQKEIADMTEVCS